MGYSFFIVRVRSIVYSLVALRSFISLCVFVRHHRHYHRITAIQQMCAVIQRLVNESLRDQLYEKALTCLRALRAGAVREDEATAFNDFLRRCVAWRDVSE